MPLSDDLIVYPNHGAGSACGKNMSKETTDTLGNQKRTNYALRPDMSPRRSSRRNCSPASQRLRVISRRTC